MLTSGVILDFYDDSRGELFRGRFPDQGSVPDIVKTAHALSGDELASLPDEDFALVLVDERGASRKYACVDEGNTALSVLYFLNNGHKLPVEAQKTAAANLKTACLWYGQAPPEALEKIALGFNSLVTAATLPGVVRGVHGEKSARREVTDQANGMVMTPRDVQQALGRVKGAEVSMTPVMPGVQADRSPPTPKKSTIKTAHEGDDYNAALERYDTLNAPARRGAFAGGALGAAGGAALGAGIPMLLGRGFSPVATSLGSAGGLAVGGLLGHHLGKRGIEDKEEHGRAAQDLEVKLDALLNGPLMKKIMANYESQKRADAHMGNLVHGAHGEVSAPDETPPVPLDKKQPGKLPQMKVMQPHVYVGDKEPYCAPTEKKASRYALGDKYPLDGYDQIKTAAEFFDTFGTHLPPEERHEYCRNLVKRASEVGIETSEAVRRYGSSKKAEPEEMKIAFDSRRVLLTEDVHRSLLMGLEKEAMHLDPYTVIGALDSFDKLAGLDFHYDQELMDPYFSVLGVEKTAEEEYSFITGNDYVSGHDLKQLGETRSMLLKKMFGEEFSKEFRKDPIGIFKSLPVEQKKIVMRMAGEPSTGTQEL